MNHKEKHIKQILYGEYTPNNQPLITNSNHLQTAQKYITIRKEVDGVNINTQDADLIAIKLLSDFLKDKPFKQATRKDIREFANHLQQQNKKETTISLYLMKLKRFYKYVIKPDKYENGKADQRDIPYPDNVRWITYNDGEDELPLDSIPDNKDIKKMFERCKNVREQVVLVSLLDGGLRKSELIKLKLRNVHYDRGIKKFYFILPKKQRKRGLKTGQRHIILFLIPSSTAYIKDYLNHHRWKDNPDAPFIYTEDSTVKGTTPDDFMLGEMGVGQIVDRILKASGLKIHITPHTLRHISATMCCMKGFNEPMLRERFGWSPRSKMPSRYVHLANTNMKAKIKEILGIKDDETTKIDEMQLIECWNCKEENPFSYQYCFKCGADLKKQSKTSMNATELGINLTKLLDDPKASKFVNDFLATLLEQYQNTK